MQNYELMTITKPSLSDDKAKQVSKEIQDLVVSQSGAVTKTDFWGKRKFAYEITGLKEGYYDVMQFEAVPANINKLKSKLGLMDNLIRYLVTSIPNKGVGARKENGNKKP